MSLAKRFGIFALVLALASIVLIFLSPLLVKNGLRFFLWWKGREQGLTIAYQKIDAPFLKPVVIEGFRVTSARPCTFAIDMAIPRATFALNLRSLFFHSNARILHQAWIDALRCDIRRNPQQTADCNLDWRFLHRLLADDVRMSNLEFRFTNGATDLALHGATFSASEIESGRFAAKQVVVATPLFKKSFTDLRGATKWENDRLTVGALSLARGLDIETITADFSRLEKKRIGIELNLDAFGGKVRASIASESREKRILWDVAGTASSISLAQMSRALDLRSPAGGVVRASKFTFRGDTQNLSHATASIWVELGDFTWRDRVAETVMLGASLYNRQVDIGQLYVKQRTNQLTLTGEYTLPSKSADWINPNFRADISASITELGEFAKLFGGTMEDFAGALTISGTVNAREQKFCRPNHRGRRRPSSLGRPGRHFAREADAEECAAQSRFASGAASQRFLQHYRRSEFAGRSCLCGQSQRGDCRCRGVFVSLAGAHRRVAAHRAALPSGGMRTARSTRIPETSRYRRKVFA